MNERDKLSCDPVSPSTPVPENRSQYARWFEIAVGRSTEAVVVTNHAGRIVECNPAAETMFGWQREEIIGLDIDRLIVPKKHAQFFGKTLKRINIVQPEGASDLYSEDYALTASGRQLPVQITSLPTGEEDTDSVLFFLRDMSPRGNNGVTAGTRRNSSTRQEIQTVESILQTIDLRDPYTAAHQRRVAHLSWAIAEKLHLAPGIIENVYLGGSLHDIGKIGIPQGILSRPGPLDHCSLELVRQHCAKGYDILKHVDFLVPIAVIVLQHHERLDGSGYPKRLTANSITLEARIIGVADVVEAMSSHRPYRPSLGIDAALNEVTGKPQLYDEPAAEACQSLFRDMAYRLPDHDDKVANRSFSM